jgi:hypothetical protein
MVGQLFIVLFPDHFRYSWLLGIVIEFERQPFLFYEKGFRIFIRIILNLPIA